MGEPRPLIPCSRVPRFSRSTSPYSGPKARRVSNTERVPGVYRTDIPQKGSAGVEETSRAEHRRGIMTARNVIEIRETTTADSEADLSAHSVAVTARPLGGGAYLFRGTAGPFESMPPAPRGLGPKA